DAPPGVIDRGPCSSGAAGATAFRIRWAQSGSSAYVVYEVHGLPDTSRGKAGAYGYQIGFTPQYVDPFLAQGGLLLNRSDFRSEEPPGGIDRGPCSSGAAGATAFRIRWAQSGSSAYVVYEVHGLPDTSRGKAGAYGYQIGFTPQYVDPFLAQGGLLLNSSDF